MQVKDVSSERRAHQQRRAVAAEPRLARHSVDSGEDAPRHGEIDDAEQAEREPGEQRGDREVEPRIRREPVQAGRAEHDREAESERGERGDDAAGVDTGVANGARAVRAIRRG